MARLLFFPAYVYIYICICVRERRPSDDAFAHGSGCLKLEIEKACFVNANAAVITNRFAVPRSVTFSFSLSLSSRVTNQDTH